MNNNETQQYSPSDVQKHRQEKQTAMLEQTKRRRAIRLEKLVCTEVCDAYPALKNAWDSQPDSDNQDFREMLDEIAAILKFFSKHPKLSESVQKGVLD